MSAIKRRLIGLTALVALASCGPIVQVGGGSAGPASLLTLASAMPPPAATEGAPVLITLPDVPGKLRTVRVPVNTSLNELQYLADAAWIEQPNQLFQQVLADTFEAVTGRPALSEANVDVVPAARLSGQLTEFGLDVNGPPEVAVRFDAVLTAADGGYLGSRRFVASRPVAVESGPSVAAALGEASNEVAAAVAAWIESSV